MFDHDGPELVEPRSDAGLALERREPYLRERLDISHVAHGAQARL